MTQQWPATQQGAQPPEAASEQVPFPSQAQAIEIQSIQSSGSVLDQSDSISKEI